MQTTPKEALVAARRAAALADALDAEARIEEEKDVREAAAKPAPAKGKPGATPSPAALEKRAKAKAAREDHAAKQAAFEQVALGHELAAEAEAELRRKDDEMRAEATRRALRGDDLPAW